MNISLTRHMYWATGLQTTYFPLLSKLHFSISSHKALFSKLHFPIFLRTAVLPKLLFPITLRIVLLSKLHFPYSLHTKIPYYFIYRIILWATLPISLHTTLQSTFPYKFRYCIIFQARFSYYLTLYRPMDSSCVSLSLLHIVYISEHIHIAKLPVRNTPTIMCSMHSRYVFSMLPVCNTYFLYFPWYIFFIT